MISPLREIQRGNSEKNPGESHEGFLGEILGKALGEILGKILDLGESWGTSLRSLRGNPGSQSNLGPETRNLDIGTWNPT